MNMPYASTIHARAVGILGAIICMVLLFGISCSGGVGSTDASKSVSTTYTINGRVTCDHNGDGDINDVVDHPINGVPVRYRYGDHMSPWGAWQTTYTYQLPPNSKDGYYEIPMLEGYYTVVELGVPTTDYAHWVHYNTGGDPDFVYDYDERFEVPPPNGACYPLCFVGTDWEP
jgi:hypothetical protein